MSFINPDDDPRDVQMMIGFVLLITLLICLWIN